MGKLFARVVLNRLKKLADRVYQESQCGFRRNPSTIDMIFSLRQLQEKCREQNKSLYTVFIDMTKAFDFMSRDGLFKVLARIGCPKKLIKSFHDGMKGVVQFDGASSTPFNIKSGVKTRLCTCADSLQHLFCSCAQSGLRKFY